MRHRVLALLAALLSLYIPQMESSHAFSPSDLVNLDRISSIAARPSGKSAAFTRWTYDQSAAKSTTALYLTSLESANQTQAITSPAFGTSDNSPVWLDENTLLFLSAARTPDATTQAFSLNVSPSGQQPVQITSFPLSISNLKVFTRNGEKMIAFTARVYATSTMEETKLIDAEKAKDPSTAMVFDKLYFRHWDTFDDHKYSHLFIAPLGSAEDSYVVKASAVDLMANLELETPVAPFGGASDFTISPDGFEIAFAAHNPGVDQAWSTDVDIYLVSTNGTLAPKPIGIDNLGADSLPVYSPDGKYLAYLSMKVPKYEADRRRVMLYTRSSQTLTTLVADWDRSPSSLVWSLDSSKIYMTVPDVAKENIYQLTISTQALTKIAQGGFFSDLHATSKGLVCMRNTQLTPNEIFTLEGTTLTQRTYINQAKLAEIRMSQPQEFLFQGTLGDQVHGWIIKPVDYVAGAKYPVAFLVHGGPQSAWMDSFSTRWNPQAFAGAGFAVVAIDPHGSTSYGQAFCDAINGEWGSYPFEDLMIGLDHVISTYDFVDGNRVAALGASYGGYMMNWFNGNTDRFSCLVNHCGLSDTTAMYFSTEELFFPEYDFRGTPWESDLYERWNPMNLVTNWKTPTLVVHGAKDYRVVDGQGFITFTALKRQGIDAKLLYFPDENHWVIKPANSLRWYEEVLAWITKYTSE